MYNDMYALALMESIDADNTTARRGRAHMLKGKAYSQSARGERLKSVSTEKTKAIGSGAAGVGSVTTAVAIARFKKCMKKANSAATAAERLKWIKEAKKWKTVAAVGGTVIAGGAGVAIGAKGIEKGAHKLADRQFKKAKNNAEEAKKEFGALKSETGLEEAFNAGYCDALDAIDEDLYLEGYLDAIYDDEYYY